MDDLTRETWASANRRRACLVCGTSGAALLSLPDGRNIRACDRCIRSDMAREAWAGAEPRDPLPSEVSRA